MTVPVSILFDFIDSQSSFEIERHVVESTAFGDLRRSLRLLIIEFCEIEQPETIEIAGQLRSVLFELLTVPVIFDDSIIQVLQIMGDSQAIEARWGTSIRDLYERAFQSSEELKNFENPVRVKLKDIIKDLIEIEMEFRIFCHKRARKYFESLSDSPEGINLPDKVFIHSLAEYREVEPFPALLKVGPLRSRGWGAIPDAVVTAPRFSSLVQVVWSGCRDEQGFGFDPVSTQYSLQINNEQNNEIDTYSNPYLQFNWDVRETKIRDNTVGVFDEVGDGDEFEEIRGLTEDEKEQRAMLIQVINSRGFLFNHKSRILSYDLNDKQDPIGYRIPGETLEEEMYIIISSVKDIDQLEHSADPGYFSSRWKDILKARYFNDVVTLENALWDNGLELLNLRSRIEFWCTPSTNVIHAPREMNHFRILIEVLGLDFEPREQANMQRPWWEYAWDEIRRSRGEAIQIAHLEQHSLENHILSALYLLKGEIESRLHEASFELQIPHGQPINGLFEFYKILGIEEGYQVPKEDLKKLYELKRIDQWRV